MRLLRCGALLIAFAALAPAQSTAANKTVHEARVLDDMKTPTGWKLEGAGEMSFRAGGQRPRVRVDVTLQGRKGLPSANGVKSLAGEDWSGYNRLSFWLRTDVTGFPVLTLIVTLRNQGKNAASEVHLRESGNNVTLPNGTWTQVFWEIPHLKRDHVTALEFHPWVNKRLPAATDVAAYEIGPIELQRVDADQYEGWNVAPGKIAFSHTGYLPAMPKTALASGLSAGEFRVMRAATGVTVLRKKVEQQSGRLGNFQVLDFSEVREPGAYVLSSGGVTTQPFRIDGGVWDQTIAKTVNFFHGERCGMPVPGMPDVCHRDWQAVHDGQKIVMNGGWHDAGDLSQGLVNTGEATHAMFALAADARASGRNPAWLAPLVDEARWGLAWIHKVRFPGGFRVGFASLNIWTNGIIGDEDDRTATALNNPNVNYIAAAAGASAARYFAATDPELAKKSLAIAEEDWRYAIAGVETPANLSTPAYAASEMEMAASGIVASVELYQATGREEFARKAWELARIVAASQQTTYVGTTLPLAGFFYTGPARKQIFHEFHRGNDQVPIVAMTMLCDAFPDHPDWMQWYAVAARYSEYQKHAAVATAPYAVLPAYVYRDDEWQHIADGDRYGSSREAFRLQVLAGTPMGGGYYLRNFPVWFTRRGNYGVLLSQTEALSSAGRLRRDSSAAELVQAQLQWVVGRNPFSQSTMWGVGYDFAPQYSVSVGDIAGSLPVGMMTHDNADSPYWPATNTYVFKEVWVHPSARWLSIMKDVVAPPPSADFKVTQKTVDGSIEITAVGAHTFALRSANLVVEGGPRRTAAGVTWKAHLTSPDSPWFAVVIADGNAANRREVMGYRATPPA
ncbi:MAG TPA: glycoside hydrolase family 9 protein [Candidatus Sulfopaludibacter sp.]|jgi:hypothetical protein|nr:glycoside hydrolase family 9 protein [Candidatus Sulfopaludibacter sp.]